MHFWIWEYFSGSQIKLKTLTKFPLSRKRYRLSVYWNDRDSPASKTHTNDSRTFLSKQTYTFDIIHIHYGLQERMNLSCGLSICSFHENTCSHKMASSQCTHYACYKLKDLSQLTIQYFDGHKTCILSSTHTVSFC